MSVYDCQHGIFVNKVCPICEPAPSPVAVAREAFLEAALAEMDPENRPHNEHDHAGVDRHYEVKRRKREAYAALLAAEAGAKGDDASGAK